MAVDVRRHAGLGVAGMLLDGCDRNSHVHQERERRVPQVMKPNVRQPGLHEQFLELVLDAVPFEWRPNRGWEDQIVFLPLAASLLPLAILMCFTSLISRRCCWT